MTRWYVAQTKPNAEEKAAWHLLRQGFETFLPRHKKRRRHARRTDWIAAPLFPRYLFISIDPEKMRWRCINSTIGVSGLVCHGESPTPVPIGVVEEIAVYQDTDGLIRMDRVRPFKKGDPVQIASGAFCDRIGLFDCVTDDDRVTLLLDLLGRQVRVRVPLETIEACA